VTSPFADIRIDRPMTSLLSRRAIAALLDYGLFALLVFAYVSYFGEVDDSGVTVVSDRLALPPLILWAFLFPYTESCFSTSLGKRLFGLRIVSNDKRPLTFSRHLKRRLLDPIDLFAAYGLVAVVTIAVTPSRQRLGDLWARTRVVTLTPVSPSIPGAT